MTPGTDLTVRAVARARRTIARDHPAFRRVTPTVSSGAGDTFTLTFRTTTALPDGATLRQTLRATVDARGEVLRVVTSR